MHAINYIDGQPFIANV